MTAENLARHAEDPNATFWEMIKIGSDAFVANGRPPTVAVCERYVFNPIPTGDLDPNASCPPGIEPRLVSIVETRLPAKVKTAGNIEYYSMVRDCMKAKGYRIETETK